MTDSSRSSDPDGRSAARLILIVDDEPGIRQVVRMSIRLRGASYRTLEAATAGEALEHARETRPDIVLLDVALPDRDGFWVCRQLKSDPRTAHIPVVMLTAMSLPVDRERATAAGADGYIVKPFSPRALLDEIDRRLG